MSLCPALHLLQSNSPRCIASSQFVSYSSVHMHLCCFKFSANKKRLPDTFACRSLTSTFFFSKMFLTETDLANVALLFLFCTEDYFWQFLLLLIFYFLWCCYALLHLPEHCEWIFENPWKKKKRSVENLRLCLKICPGWKWETKKKKKLFGNILYFLKQISKYNAKHRR